ncbi:MAG: hypothetical protein RLZZ618_4085 [Pseudomonadota bacterium]|jgi:hypothetical protein
MRFPGDNPDSQPGQLDAERRSHPGWRLASKPPVRPAPAADASFHGPRGPQARSLTAAAHLWLAKLPPRYQPLALARRHPHIVNQLEALWGSPARLSGYFRELLLSHRLQRAGFSFDVLTELTDLQSLNQQRQRHSRH